MKYCFQEKKSRQRPIDVSREGLKFYPCRPTLFIYLFILLSIHRTQQRRSGWPSNIYRRFGCRY